MHLVFSSELNHVISSTGRNDLPGAGPAGDRDNLSDEATIALLKRRLMEAEHNVKLWKEQAEEARNEYIKCKSNAKVLQTELENTQKELARVRGESPKQGGVVSREQQVEIGEFRRSSTIDTGSTTSSAMLTHFKNDNELHSCRCQCRTESGV